MKFISKVSGAVVLVLAVLAGVFSSCTYDLDPEYLPGDAKINVSVTYRFDSSNVTTASEVTVKSDVQSENVISYQNGVITVQGAYSGKKIVYAQKLTVTATYKSASGKTYTESAVYDVPAVKYNEHHVGSVAIPLGPVADGYKEQAKGKPVESIEYKYLQNATHAHSHAGREVKWMENATSSWLTCTETVTYVSGNVVENFAQIADDNVKQFAAARNTGRLKANTDITFIVSAWSIYFVEMAYKTSVQEWEVIKYAANGEEQVVGTYKVDTYSSSQNFGEEAHPSHSAHYHGHGHGHDHGNSDHAGGGIIIAD